MDINREYLEYEASQFLDKEVLNFGRMSAYAARKQSMVAFAFRMLALRDKEWLKVCSRHMRYDLASAPIDAEYAEAYNAGLDAVKKGMGF